MKVKVQATLKISIITTR